MQLTDKIQILSRSEPPYDCPQWGVVFEDRVAEWFNSKSEAIVYARGLDVGVGLVLGQQTKNVIDKVKRTGIPSPT